MTCLRVDIVGFADESFPGFVHCDFIDAKGNRHRVLEKIPVVTTENLWNDSTYPQRVCCRARGFSACMTARDVLSLSFP